MQRFRHLLFAAMAVGLIASVAAGRATDGPSARPRVEDVFKSMKASGQHAEISVPWVPLLMGLLAAVLMGVAVKHWNRRNVRATNDGVANGPAGASSRSNGLHDHRKLLRDASRATGLSRRRLKQIAPLTAAHGLSSPLVAMICPSAIKRVAEQARTREQLEALHALAGTLMKAEA